jgi:RimJ/RimL family protein N-acetyltransferase
MSAPRFRIEWSSAGEELVVEEPTWDEVARVAPLLAAAYNDPHNRAMLTHDEDMTAADVVQSYTEMAEAGARQLLLYRDAVLAGDADFRSLEAGRAEFALLVAARSAQKRGLGTRFAIMAHAFGFSSLGLERSYVTMLAANLGSRRVFEKLGYTLDDSPQARRYTDDKDDLSMSVDRATFERTHAVALAEIRIRELAAIIR